MQSFFRTSGSDLLSGIRSDAMILKRLIWNSFDILGDSKDGIMTASPSRPAKGSVDVNVAELRIATGRDIFLFQNMDLDNLVLRLTIS